MVRVRVKDGSVLVGIRYQTCKNTRMRLTALSLSGPVRDGIHERIWWKVTSSGSPDRIFATYSGSSSVEKLLNTYALLDNNACMNIDRADIVTRPRDSEEVRALERSAVDASFVPMRAQSDAYGIPQRQANSGICWYAALMFVLCHNLDVRNEVEKYLPEEAIALLRECMHSPASAEKLREFFWNTYGMGDPYGQAPELDGQNGLTQFYVLAGRTGIPVLRYFVDKDGVAHKLTDPVKSPSGELVSVRDAHQNGDLARILTFRFRRGAHERDRRMQPPRRKVVCGRRFRLTGMMIGSEHCGHQIAACASGRSWREWAVCDSDAQHRGIGVTHWKCTAPTADKAAWWEAWRAVVPTVRFHGGYCNLSPQNAPVHAKSSEDAGMTNVDFVYLAE